MIFLLSWYTWHLFLSPLKLLGSLLPHDYGMIVNYGRNISIFYFWYSDLSLPTYLMFFFNVLLLLTGRKYVGCIHLVSSSLLVNSRIMLFFTCFPSKLISHHVHVKQKRSLLLLILFVFLWTFFFFLLWISSETKSFISSNFKYVAVRPNLIWFNHGIFPDYSMEKSKHQERASFQTCFRKIRHLSLLQMYRILSTDWCRILEANVSAVDVKRQRWM